MTPAIDIRNLVKRYGTFEAVRGISIDVAPGRFFGFLGPNGAGKTTTIQILTGLSNRTSGEIRVFGEDVTRDYLHTRRRIGLASQEFNFDRFFPVSRILEFQGGYFGLPPKAARSRAEELLHRLDLWNHRDAKSPKLSGGLKRRLQIAKALVHNPDILILDEPTAGLDVELRIELWEHLRELNRAGKTIFLTTHYLEEAERLCDEIAIINEGRIVERGTTGDLLKKGFKKLEDLFLSHVQPNRGSAHV